MAKQLEEAKQKCWVFHTDFNKAPLVPWERLVGKMKGLSEIEYCKAKMGIQGHAYIIHGFIKFETPQRQSTVINKLFSHMKKKPELDRASNIPSKQEEEATFPIDDADDTFTKGEYKNRT